MQELLATGVEHWDQETFVIGSMICVIVFAVLFHILKRKFFDKEKWDDDYDPWDIRRDR